MTIRRLIYPRDFSIIDTALLYPGSKRGSVVHAATNEGKVSDGAIGRARGSASTVLGAKTQYFKVDLRSSKTGVELLLRKGWRTARLPRSSCL